MIEQTLLIIKPNAVKEKNVGRILKMIEDEGFAIQALEMFAMDEDLAETFYSAHQEEKFFKKLIDFMISSPCVAVVLEKNDAVSVLRNLAGDTDPQKANEGTIRHLYGNDVTKNGVHTSDSLANADREIKLLFPD